MTGLPKPMTATEINYRIEDNRKRQEILDLLVTCAFGLRAQGHIPTIEQMLKDGHGWQEIGTKIGWCPVTAERFYKMESSGNPG